MRRFIWMTLAVLIGVMAGFGGWHNGAVCRAEIQAEQPLDKEKSCDNCGMFLGKHKNTAVYIDYKDGTSEEFCGVGCAIKRINQRGGYKVVRLARVTSWGGGELVDMKSAGYVRDSKVATDMTTKTIAFASEDAARKFIEANGGNLVSFFAILKGTPYREKTR